MSNEVIINIIISIELFKELLDSILKLSILDINLTSLILFNFSISLYSIIEKN